MPLTRIKPGQPQPLPAIIIIIKIKKRILCRAGRVRVNVYNMLRQPTNNTFIYKYNDSLANKHRRALFCARKISHFVVIYVRVLYGEEGRNRVLTQLPIMNERKGEKLNGLDQ